MHKLFFFIAAAVISLFTLSCSQTTPGSGNAGDRGPDDEIPGRIIPQPGEAIQMSEAEVESVIETELAGDVTLPIQLPDDYLIIDAQEINLDLDEMDEQVVVYKRQGDESDRIHVMLLDYDFVRSGYAISWEAVTSSTVSRSVKIQAADLTGNGISEIILFGVDGDGRQTLDAYTTTSEMTGQGLQLQEILELSIDGTIELQEPDRSEEYLLSEGLAEAYRIIVQRQDENSSNIMDLVQEEYTWNRAEQRYLLADRRRIPGDDIEESQLQSLYSSGAAEFESFLNGPWYRSRSANPNEPDAVIVTFFPQKREIIFYTEDMQQIFTWDVSSRSIFRNIRIDIRNQILPSISTFGSVAVQGLDSIQLEIQNYHEWDGEYRRISDSLQTALQQNARSASIARDPEYVGLFENETGTELLLENARFSLSIDGQDYRGGYGIYDFQGTRILELQAMSEFGLPRQRFLYAAEMESDRTEDQIIRRLQLTPISLFDQGMREASGDIINLEQVIEQSGE